jgi:hypothetical protein
MTLLPEFLPSDALEFAMQLQKSEKEVQRLLK